MLDTSPRLSLVTLLVCFVALAGCQRAIGDGDSGPEDSGTDVRDTGTPPVDAGPPTEDSGSPADAGPPMDAGGETDAGPSDAGPSDAGTTDAGETDAGTTDASVDSGVADAGDTDAGTVDAGDTDAGSATTVVYPLDDRTFMDETSMTIEDLDDGATMTLTVSGLSMTAAASDGTLNQTATGFGINHSGTGDATDQIDGDAGIEVLTITFDMNVSLIETDLSSLSGSDEASIAINGGSPMNFTSSGVVDLGGAALATGQTLTFTHVAGNGFQVDSVTVTVP